VAGTGVGTGDGLGAGEAVGPGVRDALAEGRTLGLSDGIGVAQAARPAAEAAAPSWSSRRRLIGAGCGCIGSLSAEASEVRVPEIGGELEAVAQRSVHPDVRQKDGAGQRERSDRRDPADAQRQERRHQVMG
jgi:hypothetical protein